MVSFVIMGLCGILANILIGHFFDTVTLGIFNQVWAFYIFLSQLGAYGIHYSVLKFIAEVHEDMARTKVIALSAIVLAVVFASVLTAFSCLAPPVLESMFKSPELAEAWMFAVPGLWFFCINKVLLAIINGRLQMKTFAVANSSRYIILVFGILVMAQLKLPRSQIPMVLSVAEGVMFVGLVAHLQSIFRPVARAEFTAWIRSHLSFGTRSFVSGALMELNTRVDIIVLGFCSSDAAVGIYSMAASVAEGFAQIATVLRNNFNPIITRLYYEGKLEELSRQLRRGRNLFYISMFPASLLAIGVFPFFIEYVVRNNDFIEGWWPFTFLVGGVFAASGYLPFIMIFLQAGRPLLHTIFQSTVVVVNFALNLALVPVLGAKGAGLATGLSFVFMAAGIGVLSNRRLQIRI